MTDKDRVIAELKETVEGLRFINAYLRLSKENLKCCGNCKHSVTSGFLMVQTSSLDCNKYQKSVRPNEYCGGDWEHDGLTQEQRGKQ